MMTTRERAHALSEALLRTTAKWQASPETLMEALAQELGHREALDHFVERGSQRCRARAPQRLVHILSSNTPESALQSLGRGILLGCPIQFAKLPRGVDLGLNSFLAALPPSLSKSITCSETLPDQVLSDADAVIAFGSEESLARIHSRLRHDQIWQAHGHKISIAVLEEFPNEEMTDALIKDLSLFDQLGCLSVQQLCLGEAVWAQADKLLDQLAKGFERYEKISPRGPVPEAVSCRIHDFRTQARLSAASNASCMFRFSSHNSTWSLALDSDPSLQAGPGYRFLRLSPLPKDLNKLGPERHFLSTIALHPYSSTLAEKLATLPASRFCPLGRCQLPTPFWHHDGYAPLASLVTWQDFESD